MTFLFRASAIFVCVAWLCAASASANPAVVNGDFEAENNFTVWPGYVGGENPPNIPGWTGPAAGHGINPVVPVDDPANRPFGNGNNATQFAFLQGAMHIEQSIGGFEAGADYVLSLDFNARNCCGDVPIANVLLNGAVVASSTDVFPGNGGVAPTAENEDWYHTDIPFTADTDTYALRIETMSAAGGDSTFIVDNIQIVPEPTAGILALLGFGILMLRRRRRK